MGIAKNKGKSKSIHRELRQELRVYERKNIRQHCIYEKGQKCVIWAKVLLMGFCGLLNLYAFKSPS